MCWRNQVHVLFEQDVLLLSEPQGKMCRDPSLRSVFDFQLKETRARGTLPNMSQVCRTLHQHVQQSLKDKLFSGKKAFRHAHPWSWNDMQSLRLPEPNIGHIGSANQCSSATHIFKKERKTFWPIIHMFLTVCCKNLFWLLLFLLLDFLSLCREIML